MSLVKSGVNPSLVNSSGEAMSRTASVAIATSMTAGLGSRAPSASPKDPTHAVALGQQAQRSRRLDLRRRAPRRLVRLSEREQQSGAIAPQGICLARSTSTSMNR